MSETEILDCLRAAYRCALRRDMRGYREHMERASEVSALLQANDPLRGELALARSFEHGRALERAMPRL